MRSLRRGAEGLGAFFAGGAEPPDFCVVTAEMGSRPAVFFPCCVISRLDEVRRRGVLYTRKTK